MGKHASYAKAIGVLRKKQLMNADEIEKFERALAVLTKKFEQKKNMEMMLGDIPNKYLDPIMQTLMTDPVILVRNKNAKDTNKYVIERHLMNNPNNPFNREPLSKNDLIPDTELKEEIDEWIKQTLAKHEEEEKKEQHQ